MYNGTLGVFEIVPPYTNTFMTKVRGTFNKLIRDVGNSIYSYSFMEKQVRYYHCLANALSKGLQLYHSLDERLPSWKSVPFSSDPLSLFSETMC